jgi:2,4-dienoyl-CoA reductase-like NADH-dependent reductase (Old Yellow Enzyme family)
LAEATAVEARGRISPWDLGIWKEEHVEPLQRITKFIKQQGAVPGIQLAHAGRKASTDTPWRGSKPLSASQGGWRTVAPSEIPFDDGYPVPSELTARDIGQIVTSFVEAAKRALRAGFEVIEIHGAHGYLIHEFFSPLSNRRGDDYGGSFENRTRFVVEIVKAVRAVWPQRLPLFLRISATDWVNGGWTPEDSVKLARTVKLLGIDVVDCSSGANAPRIKIPLGPGYQVPFAEKVRREAGVLTGAVGLITEADQADALIREGKADLVLLAREFLREPYWAIKAAHQLGHEPRIPVQYARAFPKS